MTEPAALSPKQVADALQMSRRQVYRWIKAGSLKSTKIDDTHRIFEHQLAEKIGDAEARAVFRTYDTRDD